VVFMVMIFSLCIGSVRVSLNQIFNPSDRIIKEILLKIRLPRIILGFSVGGALAIAGVILQGLFRNPLVEPYTLGISGGAGVFICLNIVLKIYQKFGMITSPLELPVGVITGIIGGSLFIYVLVKKENNA